MNPARQPMTQSSGPQSNLSLSATCHSTLQRSCISRAEDCHPMSKPPLHPGSRLNTREPTSCALHCHAISNLSVHSPH